MKRAALLAACALAGCGTAGNGRVARLEEPAAQAQFVPGISTEAEVRAAFGDGAVIRFQSGVETWQYLYRDGVAKGWDEVPYIGLLTSRLDRPTKELVLLFDAHGVLRRWSLQQYDDRPWRPSEAACPPEPAASLAATRSCTK